MLLRAIASPVLWDVTSCGTASTACNQCESIPQHKNKGNEEFSRWLRLPITGAENTCNWGPLTGLERAVHASRRGMGPYKASTARDGYTARRGVIWLGVAAAAAASTELDILIHKKPVL